MSQNFGRFEHVKADKMAHCINIAEYCRVRAGDYNLDENSAYIIGLLHDVGYLHSRREHEEKGAAMLAALGMDDLYVDAVMYHGVNPYSLSDKALQEHECDVDALRECPEVPFSEISEKIKSNRYLTLLYEADNRVNARGENVGFHKRHEDIKRRNGEDHPSYYSMKRESDYVFEYCKEYGILPPPTMKEIEARHSLFSHSARRRAEREDER